MKIIYWSTFKNALSDETMVLKYKFHVNHEQQELWIEASTSKPECRNHFTSAEQRAWLDHKF